jgi:hypothetical protein
MTHAAAAKRVSELVDEINKHRRAYYSQDSVLISDADYDALMRELEALEAEHPDLITGDSPTQSVGGEATTTFSPVQHLDRMWSLDNVFGREEMAAWLAKNASGPYLCELKIDGLAINLRYENGKLVSAATRGDGVVGEDVTANVLTIKSIPRTLSGKGHPPVVEVRGEIYLPMKEFHEMNERINEEGGKAFANPRNAASGSLRQKDSSVTASRPLRMLVHGIGAWKESGLSKQSELYELLGSWGLPTSDRYRVVDSAADVQAYIDNFGAGFVALRGSADETRAVAKHFKARADAPVEVRNHAAAMMGDDVEILIAVEQAAEDDARHRDRRLVRPAETPPHLVTRFRFAGVIAHVGRARRMHPDRQIMARHGGEDRLKLGQIKRLASDVGENLDAARAKLRHRAVDFDKRAVNVQHRDGCCERREAIWMLRAQFRHAIVADAGEARGILRPAHIFERWVGQRDHLTIVRPRPVHETEAHIEIMDRLHRVHARADVAQLRRGLRQFGEETLRHDVGVNIDHGALTWPAASPATPPAA